MGTQTKLMTVAEFLELPDPPGGHYELRHGHLCFMSYPKSRHTKLQRRLRKLLESRLDEEQWVVGVEQPFRPFPEYEVWAADVAIVSAERDAVVDSDDYLQGAPEIVIEVLLASNMAEQIDDHRNISLASGCKEFWVVNSKLKTVDITVGNMTQKYTSAAVIDVFGAKLPVEDVFKGL